MGNVEYTEINIGTMLSCYVFCYATRISTQDSAPNAEHIINIGLGHETMVCAVCPYILIRTTTHTFRHCNTHTHSCKHSYAELVMGMIMGFEALYAGRGRRNPVWSDKEAHWSLRGLIVKSAEHCGADYKPLVR